MKRTCILLTLLLLAGISSAVENGTDASTVESSGLQAKRIQALEQQLTAITDPAAKLYFKATIERLKGDPSRAVRTLSELIVHFSRDETWISRAELLSAELYLEMGLTDSAGAIVRQIQLLYEGTDAADQAAVLQSKINELKESAK